jgi:crotonobetainyl-CoA:carnitine CoA-transferase CaiB-like acyl-CoA transferase
MEEALESAPVRALGMLAGDAVLPPVCLSEWAMHQSGPAPVLGQHTAGLLAELGYDATAVQRLRERGAV